MVLAKMALKPVPVMMLLEAIDQRASVAILLGGYDILLAGENE